MATSAIAVFAAPLAAEAQEAAKVAGPAGHSATSRRCREGGARAASIRRGARIGGVRPGLRHNSFPKIR
jgi:hypothetical protein